MNRLLAGFFGAALVVACSGAPGAPPGAPGSPAGDVALEQLCGQDQASLGNIAGQLDQVDATTDTTPLSTTIGTAMSNLQGLTVEPAAQLARDAALTALQQVQSALADPATAAAAATEAAVAIRTLDAQICG